MTLVIGREVSTRAIKIAIAIAFEKTDRFDIATSYSLPAVEPNSNFRIALKEMQKLNLYMISICDISNKLHPQAHYA